MGTQLHYKEPEKVEPKSFFTDDSQRYSFYFDIYPELMPAKIDIHIKPSTLLEDVLSTVIEDLNQKIVSKNMKLSKETKLYKVRLTGKNFKPKTDLPAMSLFQKICDLKVQNFAVQVLNRQQAISTVNKMEAKQKTEQKSTKEQTLPTSELQKLKLEENVSSPEPKKD